MTGMLSLNFNDSFEEQTEKGIVFTMTRNFMGIAFALAATIHIGCRPAVRLPVGQGMTIASGTVNWEGVPLEWGRVSFVPLNGTENNPDDIFIAAITQGKFEVEIEPGTYRVEIRQFKDGASSGDENTPTSSVQVLPKKYNDKSEMTADVTSDGPNMFTFDLTDRQD